jgi:hypothetical protein
LDERVCLAVEDARLRMLEIGEVIVEPVDDDGAVLDLARVVSIWRVPAHGFGESEGKKTDSSHEQ